MTQSNDKTKFVVKTIAEVLGQFPEGTPARDALTARDRQPGDRLDISGYSLMASAICDGGDVRVLSNDSTHFLVVWVSEIHPAGMGMLMRSYEYGPYPTRAYMAAMTTMADVASRKTPSIDDLGGWRAL